jgi:hypothetical protein
MLRICVSIILGGVHSGDGMDSWGGTRDRKGLCLEYLGSLEGA